MLNVEQERGKDTRPSQKNEKLLMKKFKMPRISSLSILFFGASASSFVPIGDVLRGSYIDIDQVLGSLDTPIYSVSTDPRSANWTTVVPSSLTEQQKNRFLPIRVPLIKAVAVVDLSDPLDIENIEALLYTPKAMDLHIYPIGVAGSHSNAILTRCYPSITQPFDFIRLKDFIATLADLTLTRRSGNPMRPEAAILACRLYTQNLASVNEWIDSPDWSEWNQSELKPHTVIMNSYVYENVTLDVLGPILLRAQYDSWQELVRDEL